mgnify:CR=1 FL=1
MKKLLLSFIRFYQKSVSPLFPARCRFRPTCSAYAIEAIRWYGAARGTLKAAWRILRCNPWGGCGFDPAVKRVPYPPHRE